MPGDQSIASWHLHLTRWVPAARRPHRLPERVHRQRHQHLLSSDLLHLGSWPLSVRSVSVFAAEESDVAPTARGALIACRGVSYSLS